LRDGSECKLTAMTPAESVMPGSQQNQQLIAESIATCEQAYSADVVAVAL